MENFITFFETHTLLVSGFLCFLALALFLEYIKGGKPLTAVELTRLINDDKAVVIDIRNENDFKTGHIVNAINVPANKLLEQINILTKAANKDHVLVCATGMQSRTHVEKLQEKGIQVTRLAGGVQDWTASNNLLAKS